jgi:preprotein translocase subunit SecE
LTKVTTAQPSNNRLVEYIRDTRSELRKVVWPTREEAVNLTTVVLLVTMIMTVILASMDWAFGQVLDWLTSLAA